MLRIGWQRVDAKLIDSKLVRRDAYQSEMGGRTPFQVWDYMVELADASRLVIREKSFELPNDLVVGATVPVLVNGRRTKAAFDLKDPRLNWQRAAKRRDRDRSADDKVRFERKLRGED